jgi:methionyl-tRNA formyltransferase
VRIAFFGTPALAVPSLEASIAAGHEVALVVTQPDRPAGRSREPLPPPVKERALERGLPVLQPRKLGDAALREAVARAGLECLVVVAYGRILPDWLLGAAPLGAINLHFSLLPAYRGAAPVQWALARGESVTGVTTMRISARLDEGDILLQERVPIEEGEHTPALQARLASIGSRLLVRTLEDWARGAIEPRPQDERLASLAPLLRREDGEIDPALPAREIEGRVRGFDPWPGAWVLREGRRLRLVEARAVADRPARDVPPGTVLEDGEEAFLVACGALSTLRVTRIQLDGGRVLDARSARNGRLLRAGDRLVRAGGSE